MPKQKKDKLLYTPIRKDSYGYIYDHVIIKFDYDVFYDDNNNSTITNGRITEIDKLCLYKSISGRNSIKSIKDYCLDRFINKKFNKDVVSFVTKSGYYGDEGNYEVAISFSEELNCLIDRLNNIDENETKLIEESLILEYGYILPELCGRSWIFRDNILLKEIHPAAGMRHVDYNIVNQYKNQYIKENYNLTCLCLHQRLIDGYHRYSAANQLMLKSINAIDVDY